MNVIDRFQQEEDITEVTGILLANGHAIESIFDVKFGKYEWEINIMVICHVGY